MTPFGGILGGNRHFAAESRRFPWYWDTASVSGGPAIVVATESTAELRALGQAIERLRRSLARSMARPGRDDTDL